VPISATCEFIPPAPAGLVARQAGITFSPTGSDDEADSLIGVGLEGVRRLAQLRRLHEQAMAILLDDHTGLTPPVGIVSSHYSPRSVSPVFPVAPASSPVARDVAQTSPVAGMFAQLNLTGSGDKVAEDAEKE